MYIELAVLALFVFGYSLVAGRLASTRVSGPLVFVLAGLVMGPFGLAWFDGDATRTEFRVLADLTLATVLFTDAANADLGVLRRNIRLPARMLALGLPGAMLLGGVLAALLFDVLTWAEAAILGVMLASTDAALGKAVVTNQAVPGRLREGLSFESGLNDGLAVPFLFVFIAIATGGGDGESGAELALNLVAEELGIGLAVGLGITLIAGILFRWCLRRGWITEVWTQINIVALAIGSFAVAQSLGGSGYIAAFSGGLLFGAIAKRGPGVGSQRAPETKELLLTGEAMSETLSLMTWMLFGAMVVGSIATQWDWTVLLYAVLSLTLVRMLPVFLALGGTGEDTASKLFLGWFGPRGLASIVFAIIVLNEAVPNGEFIGLVVATTVLMSLVAHGISANPLAQWIGRKEGADPA
jgi:NhaP-type Na+/H+ or K+/H+ antiporter